MIIPNNLSFEEKLLLAKLDDSINIADKSGNPRFVGFLNEREQIIAKHQLSYRKEIIFYGGYPNARRTVLAVGISDEIIPKEYEGFFPIQGITYLFRQQDSLSHRDFLGAVLAQGIKRESVGDILVSKGYCILYCLDSVAPLLLDINKVGRVGVKAIKGVVREIPPPQFLEKLGVVSSLRLDCVLSMAYNFSRTKSAEIIKSGLVEVDYFPQIEPSIILKIGAICSVRGYGKFQLFNENGKTGKGKHRITINMFK